MPQKQIQANNKQRIAKWNNLSREEIQSIPPEEIPSFLTMSSVFDVLDEKFYYLTSEQLNYIPAKIMLNFPSEILKDLYELYKNEIKDVEIIKPKYDTIQKVYYNSTIEVAGNGVRIKNALRLQKEREDIQKELLGIRSLFIDNYEVDGAVPLQIVLAYIQDAYFAEYFSEFSFLNFAKIQPAKVKVPKEHKFYGDIFVYKTDVLNFLNSRITNKELYSFTEIPKLCTIYSLFPYKIYKKHHKYKQLKRVLGDKMLIVKIKRQDFILEEDFNMMIACI